MGSPRAGRAHRAADGRWSHRRALCLIVGVSLGLWALIVMAAVLA